MMKKNVRRIKCILMACLMAVGMLLPMMEPMKAEAASMESAVQWAIGIAQDDSHGYSQTNRNGNPDYDCSSLVYYALKNTGFSVPSYAFSTFVMRKELEPRGFTWIPWSSIGGTANLRRGDILLNTNYHTAIYCGNNQIVEAHGRSQADKNYDNSDVGVAKTLNGDQDGQEIRVAAYYTYWAGWDGVLRYGAGTSQTTTGVSPTGAVDICEGGPNWVRVAGWAFDDDAPTEALSIHVYVGGPAGSGAPGYGIAANIGRADVGAAFPGRGNYHGYDATIYTDRSGTQPIYIYAINIGGGDHKLLWAGGSVYIPPDKETPKISDIQVSNVSRDGWRISCKATDNSGYVKTVSFPTWRSDAMDETIRWVSGTRSGDRFYADIKVDDLGGKEGSYITHIHAYDSVGNDASVVGTCQKIDRTAPKIRDVTVTDITSTGYTVKCKVTDDSGIARVSSVELYGVATV